MGMFDHVVIHESIPLPCKKRPYGLQTKNLANELAIYVVTRFGRLVEDRNNVDQNYHGILDLIGSVPPGTGKTDLVFLEMHFQDGFLQWTHQIFRNDYDEEKEYSEKVRFNLSLWMKLLRITHIVRWELKMIFNPPERNMTYILPEKDETIPF